MSKKIEIKFLPAEYGDSILILMGDPIDTSILIDGGTTNTYPIIRNELSSIYEKCHNNLVFLTHCDDDHIGGLLELFEKDDFLFEHITHVFYNFPKSLEELFPDISDNIQEMHISNFHNGNLSVKQIKKFSELLVASNINVITNVFAGYNFEDKDYKITVLSPRIKSLERFETWTEKSTGLLSGNKDWNVKLSDLALYRDKSDTSPTNASSISFVFEYNEKKYLFLADALANDVCESLIEYGYSKDNKIDVSLTKVSHHGSKYNTSNKLLDLIHCKRYVILTNGARKHPDKESIAKIISHNPDACILFNYNLMFDQLFSDTDFYEFPEFKYEVLKESIIE